MATITLKIVAAEMRDHNRRVAPGSECAAWQDFVADCFRRYEVAPWEDAAEEIEPVQDGVNYWLRITSGENYEYNAETGARLVSGETRASEAILHDAERCSHDAKYARSVIVATKDAARQAIGERGRLPAFLQQRQGIETHSDWNTGSAALP